MKEESIIMTLTLSKKKRKRSLENYQDLAGEEKLKFSRKS
jgi:hypothetical protein